MGNIGQHYYQWRYMTSPGGPAGPATATPLPTVVPTVFTTPNLCTTTAPLPTNTGTPTTATATPTATPIVCSTPTSTVDVQGVEILNFRLAGLTETTFSFSFNTNLPATSYIRYGTSSGTYPNAIDIATTRTTSHTATLTGLSPSTLYFFTIRVSSRVDAINRTEDYFVTLDPAATATPTPTSTRRPPVDRIANGAPTSPSTPTPTTEPMRPGSPPAPPPAAYILSR